MKSLEWSPSTGEDAGKRFIITRMSAFTADRWARDIVRALARAGSRTPKEALEVGIAGLAGQSMALFGHLTDDECEKAFQGLLDCVMIDRDPGNAEVQASKLTELDISDATTLPALRAEAFKLNVDFFKAAISQIYPLVEALRTPESEHQAPNA
ncbi:hypothetical protein GS501_04975 [Saccharibacter sp. 17.LH.SD]|uniref:phage tail assembly chaperone n=1 Tax=Saccharibacter sp. 17.LH.SD TaxID=2689393 RepID=UPI00136F5223|nr:hypothetical protein [Saccharibacter sp. 17.LH.SD]MXV44400.1 hypothetical protein [Saccharibacter sp. 17.LH.SD]